MSLMQMAKVRTSRSCVALLDRVTDGWARLRETRFFSCSFAVPFFLRLCVHLDLYWYTRIVYRFVGDINIDTYCRSSILPAIRCHVNTLDCGLVWV